jgi:cytochrome c-type biogenesis protein CcmH
MNPLSVKLLLLMLLAASPALAVIETYKFSSPEYESRYHRLSFELRCPKCQNQNIADSTAPIAKDLRKLLHQQLEAGASDTEVREYMVARYGEFVLYRPRYSGATLILWLAPLLLLLCAAAIVYSLLRKRTRATDVELNQAEQLRLDDLLNDRESRS